MADNLTIWNALKQVPPQYLKQITGGRLKGKSDVNPQWRYMIMTEQFGLVGTGWKWELKRLWNEPVSDGQVFAFAEVAVYHKIGNTWSDPIPGIGGSMLVEKESGGLHANDEGYKMAITDALSTSLKMLGVAADIYAGLWDGVKYRDVPAGKDKQTGNAEQKPPPQATTPASDHFCKEHKTQWFMTGKMKSFAHPVKDENGNEVKENGKTVWCQESASHPGTRHVENPPPPVQQVSPPAGNPTPSEIAADFAKLKSQSGTSTIYPTDPATIKTQTDLMKAANKDFKLQPDDLLKELNLAKWSDMRETPSAAYIRIASPRIKQAV